jgi:hypothetical protein
MLKSGVHNDVHLKYEGQNAAYTFTAVARRSVTLSVTKPVTSPAGSCLQMVVTERFSSSDLAGLEDVYGLGQLPGLPRAAAEFAQDAPGFELGVGAFAGAA